jgi:hypothetical protein
MSQATTPQRPSGTSGGNSPAAATTDASVLKTKLDASAQEAITLQPRSSKSPTDDELLQIANLASNRGLPIASFCEAAILLAMEAMDKGATDSTVFTSKSGTFETKSLALACKDAGVPVHKLCYFYTKPAFANRQRAGLPPARWANENVPAAYKWAAFDTATALFDPYVLESALPFDPPSAAAMQAHEVFRKDNLSQAAMRNQLLGNQAAITRGRLDGAPALPPPAMYFIEPPST